MNEKQKNRFWELKGKKSLTASQREELVKLEEKAVSTGLSLETLEPASSGSSITENELSEIVKSSVEDQLFGLREEILDEVKKASDTEEVEEIVKKYANEIDVDALTEKIGEKVAESKLDVETLTEAFKSAVSGLRSESKMAHSKGERESTPLIEMPFGDSKESLTVAQKQLHNVLLHKHVNEGIPESSLKTAEARGSQRLSRIMNRKISGKALDTGSGNDGTHFSRVNVDLASELQERLYAESLLANKLTSVEINMPTNPFKLPVATSRPNFRLQAENAATATTASDVGTANVTLDTFKLVGISDYSYEVDEDSVLAILPIITQQLSSSAADAFEAAIINGSKAGTHFDGDTDTALGVTATLPEAAVEGLVQKALTGAEVVENTAGAFSTDKIGKMRGKMGVYGLRPQDLALIVSIQDYNALVVHEDIAQARMWGEGNSLRNGNADQVFGIDVIPSGQMRDDVDATGVQNGGNDDTFGRSVLMHVPSFVVGVRRGFTVEVDRDMKRQVNSVIASFRRDFQSIGTVGGAAGEVTSMSLGINIT
jgi:HK97 family phage major capsid protein